MSILRAIGYEARVRAKPSRRGATVLDQDAIRVSVVALISTKMADASMD